MDNENKGEFKTKYTLDYKTYKEFSVGYMATKKSIVGYILFTKIKIGKSEELALAPLAVLPEYQRQGIGSELIEQGHTIAKKLGYHYVVVLGSEKYYPRFGYVSAIKFGISAPFNVPSENFMAKKLKDTNKEIKGIVKYAKEFGI